MNFALRQTYSFDVHPVGVLGNGFKNVVALAVMDPATALKEIDIYALHAQVYPSLPAGSPKRPTDYDYVKFRMPNGEETVLGMPWIKEDTITQITTSVIKVTLGGVTPADVTKVRNALVQNGFTNYEISVDDVVVPA